MREFLFSEGKWTLWVIFIVGFVLIVSTTFWKISTVQAATSDPNCTLISQEANLKTYYCFNPENGNNYYRNNLGFIVLDNPQ